MNYRCPHCGTNGVPFFKAIFCTSRTCGVECNHCHKFSTRPIWTFIALALLLPIWWVWERTNDVPEQVAIYGLEVAALWAVLLLVASPMKKLPDAPSLQTPPHT